MQAAIAQLEAVKASAVEAVENAGHDFAEDEEADDEEAVPEEEEPATEEEWLAKLLMQQKELARLRAAIEAAKAGADTDNLQLHDIDEEEEDEDEEGGEEDEEVTEQELQEMFARLTSKRAELAKLVETKSQIQERLASQQIPARTAQELNDEEMRAVIAHRQQAKQAVDEQERKIAQLTALQADLRCRLAELTANEGVDDNDDEVEEQEQEMANDSVERDGLAERVLELLAVKTDECQQLAAVVEEARAAGMDPENQRLQQAERNLAMRYQEIKELAAFAHRLGLTIEDDDDDDHDMAAEEANADTEAAEAALDKVQRLEIELDQCVHELRVVDSNASDSVLRHPAFRKMRAMVVGKLEALHAELMEARAAYEKMGSKLLMNQPSEQYAEQDDQEMDLSPMLKASLDKLWQRPYDCRIFTLQLMQGLAQLDNASLCMMTSCFARYLERHSVPADGDDEN